MSWFVKFLVAGCTLFFLSSGFLALQKLNPTPIISVAASGKITNLTPLDTHFLLTDDSLVVGLRSFKQNLHKKFLVWHSVLNKNLIINASDIQIKTKKSNKKIDQYKNLKQNLLKEKGLQNTGLQADNKTKKQFLTADFCPSRHKNFEQNFVKKFMASGHKNIGIAITKKWTIQHPNGFEWLLDQQKNKKLNITWINHSASHPYHFDKPLNKNFLLSNKTEIEAEILETEKLLLEHGQTPSVFFRFPGLVSDQDLRDTVIQKFGLIPLGSNAWLAKGERPTDGSIILIHGNKNEPEGIPLAEKLLDDGDIFAPITAIFDTKNSSSHSNARN